MSKPIKTEPGDSMIAEDSSDAFEPRSSSLPDLHRIAVEGSADCVLVLDRQQTVLFANRPFPGVQAGPILGRRLLHCIPESWHATIGRCLDQAFEGNTHQRFSVAISTSTGDTVIVEGGASPVTSGDRIDWVVVNAADTSEHHRLQDEIRLNADRYRFLTETISDVIWTMDLDQRITYVSPSIQTLIGYAVEEMQMMELREILAPESFALAREILLEEIRFEYQSDSESSRSRTLDLKLVRRDGSTIWCEAKMSFLRDSKGRPKGVLGVARDISTWREAQEALEASEERLRRAQRLEAVGQLAGGIAHDFNNLLTVIIGNVELMLNDFPLADPRHSQASEISKAAGRAAGLTRQLLAFGRKQMMIPKVLGLNSIVEEMAGMLRGLLGENIEVRLDLYPALARVRVDPSQIELALVNLALNARDAMPEGGRMVIETANAHLDPSRGRGEFDVIEGPYVVLAVTDSGDGIDLADQAKIFEPFFTTKKVGKGTGLGLSTVYGIVKQSGGYIFVNSRPHQGCRFEIYLPRVADKSQLTQDDPPTSVGECIGETILVVEDEDSVRNLTQEILNEYGYKVVEANRAALALDVLRDSTQKLDLLLTDVIMPGMSGTRLAREALDIRPDLTVLYMSGHNEESLDRHTDIERGRNLLPKPFSPDDLIAMVRKALDRRPAVQDLGHGNFS